MFKKPKTSLFKESQEEMGPPSPNQQFGLPGWQFIPGGDVGPPHRVGNQLIYSDGTIHFVLGGYAPDGQWVPGGCIWNPSDGSIEFPDGSIEFPDGTIFFAENGGMTPVGIEVPAGTIFFPNIQGPFGEGWQIHYNGGDILYHNGAYRYAFGILNYPLDGGNGHINLPPGIIIMPDGWILFPNGTSMSPDGSITLERDEAIS